MNEKALQDAYNMFASNGYSGSIDEFQTLINSDTTKPSQNAVMRQTLNVLIVLD